MDIRVLQKTRYIWYLSLADRSDSNWLLVGDSQSFPFHTSAFTWHLRLLKVFSLILSEHYIEILFFSQREKAEAMIRNCQRKKIILLDINSMKVCEVRPKQLFFVGRQFCLFSSFRVVKRVGFYFPQTRFPQWFFIHKSRSHTWVQDSRTYNFTFQTKSKKFKLSFISIYSHQPAIACEGSINTDIYI